MAIYDFVLNFPSFTELKDVGCGISSGYFIVYWFSNFVAFYLVKN